jgi:hypothetical protein
MAPGVLLPVTLEILDVTLMLLRRGAALESAEIAPPPGLGILLARIKPVFAGCQFADHASSVRSKGRLRFLPWRASPACNAWAAGKLPEPAICARIAS